MYLFLPVFYCLFLLWCLFEIFRCWKKSNAADYKNDIRSPLLSIAAFLFLVVSPIIGFNRYDDFRPSIPFERANVLSIEVLVAIASVSFWISRVYKHQLPSWGRILVRAGLLQGVLVSLIISIHFGGYLLNGLIFPLFGFELDAPVIAFFLMSYELNCNMKIDSGLAENAKTRMLIHQSAAFFGLLILQALILLPFGYPVDSILLAFDNSTGFTLSHLSKK
jgi:hypothetical protein